ncbi:MAG: chitobiase/beta-hexosaminidase C-terminal domain-containing protein, partial [Bacteroidaceae bacterium]|nr:chitobiase/beta-hexosaminidase C-terminal domain-containing protein [Bacteroidaceae bacterium]
MKKSLSFLRLMFIALFALMGMSVWADEVTDKLDQSVTGVTGTTYTEFSGKSVTSDAVYAGQCAGGNESIQLRSNNNNSGVITTASGGNVRKIAVVWNENTAEARTLQVYGSNTAYAAATDLYDASKQGDLLGEIPMGTRELEIEGDYAFIGFKSKSGAMYLTSVSITWETASAGPTVEKPVITPATGTYFEAQTVTITAEEGAEIYYTLNGGEEQKYEAPFSVTETTEIEAYAKKGTDVSKTTKVTVTFGPIYNTFAAANEAATSDRIVSRVNFTDALVTYVNGSNAYIQDATAGFLVYGNSGLTVGDKVTGYVQGQLYTYNGLPEVANPTVEVTVVSSGNEVKPVVVDAAELAANPLKYVSQYVTIQPSTFAEDAEVASKSNLTFTSGETELVLRNNFELEFGVEAAKEYAVSGLVTIYKDAVQLYPTSTEDIAEYVAPYVPEFAYAKYIVKNVGSGLYWGAGNDWGTRASLIKSPEFVKLDPTDMPEGQYKLESQVNNGGTQYYFNGDYMDNGNPVGLIITKLANGNYTIALASDGTLYGYDGTSTVLGKGLTNAEDPNAQWTIQSLDEAKAALANATEEAPMNASLLFDDLNFGRNNRYSNKWIVSEDCTNKNLSGGNNTNNNAESFHSVFTVSQSVE